MSKWSFKKFSDKELYAIDWKLGTFGLTFDDEPATDEYVEALSDESRDRGLFDDDAFYKNDEGLQCISEGDLEHAEVLFREAIKICPKYLTAYANLGACLTDLGRIREAISILKDGLELGFTPDLTNNLEHAESLL